MERVFVATIERPAGLVTEIERIDRILGQVRAKALLCDDGTLQVVIAGQTEKGRPVVSGV